MDPFSGTGRERSSTSARDAELLPNARVPILLSRDLLPDSSCRPGLCHCVSTVLGRSLEPRQRGFVLSALGRQLWRLSSRACMSNPNSSLNRSLELVIFCLARLTADNLRHNSAKASTVLKKHAHRLFPTSFSYLSKLHWLTQTCQSPDGRASAGPIPRALRT